MRVKTSYLLQSQHSCCLITKILLEVLGNLTHKTTKGCLADQKFGGLLVPTDLTKGNGSWTITMGLLLTPPVAGAALRDAFVASCLRGALPAVLERAVCLVRAMVKDVMIELLVLGEV